MNILILATGSISIKLFPKLIKQIEALADKGHFYKYIMSDKAQHLFYLLNKSGANREHLHFAGNYNEYTDFEKEVKAYTERSKTKAIIHVELAQWADVVLVCPATANTIAKMCSGVSDNVIMDTLLVASGLKKRIVVVPAMNTNMWESWQTQRNIQTLIDNGVEIVYPSVKQLACGDYGIGALADLKAIENIATGHEWVFPLDVKRYIPINPHPGSFGAVRKFDIHKGVDLYCEHGDSVYAVEDGEIVDTGVFTGPNANCAWWLETFYIVVKGKSGYVIYGEVGVDTVSALMAVGNVHVKAGQRIASVINVLPLEKKRADIPGHSNAMLHLELLSEYVDPKRKSSDWSLSKPRPKWLLDPTAYLKNSGD